MGNIGLFYFNINMLIRSEEHLTSFEPAKDIFFFFYNTTLKRQNVSTLLPMFEL